MILAMNSPLPLRSSRRAAWSLGLALISFLSLAMCDSAAAPAVQDPYLWLEDVTGERALNWVRERNAQSQQQLQGGSDFKATRDAIRGILDSSARIPQISRRGAWFYNLWQDGDHPRGLWRRTTLQSYRSANPEWETVLDLDALGKAEGKSWVWGGSTCLGPDYRRCLLQLSPGGSDAKVVREFDTVTKTFVQGGFELPEAKSSVDWIDTDTLYVATHFGPGSLTDSGYPRVIKRWKRGQALSEAVTVFEGRKTDVSAWVYVDKTPGFERTVFGRSPDFFTTEQFILVGDRLQALNKPADAQVTFWADQVLMQLRSDLTTPHARWAKGALLVASAADFIAGHPQWQALFTPTATRSLSSFTLTRSAVLLNVLDNVVGRLQEWKRVGSAWQSRDVDTPSPGALRVTALHDSLIKDDPLGDDYLLSYTDFLTPDTLQLARIGRDARDTLKALPAYFDASGMKVEQRFATSKDGTRVPYFVVWPKGATADGRNPTLLYGYGGFRVSQLPWYSGTYGRAWFAKGGVLVIANIRGGGEFGPAWHQAAIGAQKQKSYDDFAAVAEDLMAQRITNPHQLGIRGGSNGGLLVGAVMLQRPELFGAVVCQVPLLDMQRYHLLLAGASWMAEYGNPDLPEQWAWISKYSPYQNVRSDAKLPPVLFTTSTKDDRVHPGHARKMAARMIEQGHNVTYFENIEGGHGGAADSAQRADMLAMEFAFLWDKLGGRARLLPQPPQGEPRK